VFSNIWYFFLTFSYEVHHYSTSRREPRFCPLPIIWKPRKSMFWVFFKILQTFPSLHRIFSSQHSSNQPHPLFISVSLALVMCEPPQIPIWDEYMAELFHLYFIWYGVQCHARWCDIGVWLVINTSVHKILFFFSFLLVLCKLLTSYLKVFGWWKYE
jgi:hypothetical protein